MIPFIWGSPTRRKERRSASFCFDDANKKETATHPRHLDVEEHHIELLSSFFGGALNHVKCFLAVIRDWE